jgi:hypothetical protein
MSPLVVAVPNEIGITGHDPEKDNIDDRVDSRLVPVMVACPAACPIRKGQTEGDQRQSMLSRRVVSAALHGRGAGVGAPHLLAPLYYGFTVRRAGPH